MAPRRRAHSFPRKHKSRRRQKIYRKPVNTNAYVSNSKLYVFDLDDTLWDGRHLYPDVPHILNILRSQGHRVYVASFHSAANHVLKDKKIDHYFHGGMYGRGISKYNMIKQILEHSVTSTGQFPSAIEFYDDNTFNIKDVTNRTKRTVKAIHTPSGLTWEHILQADDLAGEIVAPPTYQEIFVNAVNSYLYPIQ